MPQEKHSAIVRWTRRIAVWFAAAVVLAWMLGTAILQLPPVKAAVRDLVVGRLGIDVQWDWLWWNPVQGVVVENVRAGSPQADGQYSFRARRLLVRVDYVKLTRKTIAVLGLDVRDPVVTLTLPVRSQAALPALDPNAVAAAPAAPADPQVVAAAMAGATGTAATNTSSVAPVPTPGQTPPAPNGPPPDVVMAVSGGQLRVIHSGDGTMVAGIRAGTFSLGPQGGSASALLGVRFAGNWRECQITMPVRWQGAAIEIDLADHVESHAQLKAMARIGMVPGFPVMVQLIARQCPVDWCTVPAALGGEVFPRAGTFSADIQALMMLARPAMRAAMVQADARDLVVPVASVPGGKALLELLGEAGGSHVTGCLGVGQIQLQAGIQGSRMEVPKFQIDAGGALASTRLATGPGGALAGETTILLGAEGEDRVRRIEEHLPEDRHLGFDGTSEVHFPDGSSARWRSRVIRLGGSITAPLAEVWPDLGFLGPGKTLLVLRSALLPADPDKVELIPLGN